MTFPTIQYKTTNTNLDSALTELLEQKFSSLEKYIGDETDIRCEVEFVKETGQQSGRIFRVEANLWLKGTLYRAAASEENFEKSVDEVRDELDKLLRRASGKRETMTKKGGKAIKDMLRFGKKR